MSGVLEGREYGETRERLMREPIIQTMANEMIDGVENHGLSLGDLFHVAPGVKAEAWTCRMEFMSRSLDEYKKRGGQVPCHIGGVAESIQRLMIRKMEGDPWPAAAEPEQAEDDADEGRWHSPNQLIEYLEGTLIPDLRESGLDATADDFESCVQMMRDYIPPGRMDGV